MQWAWRIARNAQLSFTAPCGLGRAEGWRRGSEVQRGGLASNSPTHTSGREPVPLALHSFMVVSKCQVLEPTARPMDREMPEGGLGGGGLVTGAEI